MAFGDVPVSKLFTPAANFRNINNPWEANIGSLADRSSFETMRFNEFLNNQFMSLQWRQDFRSIFYRSEKFAPHLEMVHRVAFGNLNNPEQHRNISIRDLSSGYYESGLEFNRLYLINFLAVGIGAYYRYGPNQLAEPFDNFAIKLSSKFSF